MKLINKLESIKLRFDDISQQIIDPKIISDIKTYIKLNKEYKDLEPIILIYNQYKNIIQNIDESNRILKNDSDSEMRELAKQELESLLPVKQDFESKIKFLLIPKDPEDSKNAVIEIRAGTGGDEASIFAGDLFRMYSRFCESKNWSIELVDSTDGSSGGYKEIVANISGEDVYGVLKYESGVHRVQRVPQTETQGRVHTSAATVAVLPEAEEFDIEINEKDLKKETYCSSGPGGQSVNTTYSAVRLTHLPSGVVAQCQDQKSQIKNFNKAMQVLRSRIYEIELAKRNSEIDSKRKSMVSTGDRSAKIRTYNYPQGRVTDHRINLTLYNLNDILNGDINKLIDELTVVENTQRLKEGDYE
ncbi:MAG: peptide chain release factor 1 [Flavobacteriales bacterium TMED288]|nr:peptide chain release factor 1 [Flavobacteriales bacterium]RPG53701.1 MAG: peptide chain release factor 1 [Flavobacteriales bacterium TMED288]|tara:strand:- start:943 stop:2022 length:1080 start_codon:yes stop_codon:yes gene_type:complete